MITQELIEEAKRRYPVGTEFYAAHQSTKRSVIICEITNSQFTSHEDDSRDLISQSNGTHKETNDNGYWKCVYSEGQWAEIIKLGKQELNNYPIYI